MKSLKTLYRRVRAFSVVGQSTGRNSARYSPKNSNSLKNERNSQPGKVYKEFLGDPNSRKAHELLHTHYHQRETLM
jgi:hypothetical protein